MSDVVMPAAHACGTIIIYRPRRCVTVGTARSFEEDYTIVTMEIWLMWIYDKGDMMNTVPNRQKATGWGINPTDLCPAITFIYFQQELSNSCFGRPLLPLSNDSFLSFSTWRFKCQNMQNSLCRQQLVLHSVKKVSEVVRRHSQRKVFWSQSRR